MRIFLVGFLSFVLINSCYAWSNYFRFVNNFNFPMTLSINSTQADVNNLCGGSATQVDVAAHAVSCEFEFTTSQTHWYEPFKNSGSITLARKEDPLSFCVYQYNYTYTPIPFSYFDIHSEVFSFTACQGNLKANSISVVNDHNKALPRPMVGNILLSIDHEKAAELTESLSQADCGGAGGDNCLIASPDLQTSYLDQGSTLAQSLVLQSLLDQFEPLNFEQFIGAHNAAISHHYTNSTNAYNLSYSDPDSYLTLTDQLNAGVRQIELDIEWHNNQVQICHDNKSLDPQGVLCDDNDPLSVALSEIKSWVSKNPNTLLFLYLDVHAPLVGHVSDLDQVLAALEPFIFTPAMAQQYYHVSNNTLPAYQLSQHALVQQFKKNIIITNDDDLDNLKTSQYVFVNVQNSQATPLYEIGVDTLVSSNYFSCNDRLKYSNMSQLYAGDPTHYNLWRLNGGRTVINYITSVGSLSPSQYVNYITSQNLAAIFNCPVNIWSTEMLGYTCDSDNCNSHPTDPRFYTFLWSWELGYPLEKGATIATINPTTAHFENKTLQSGTYSILCYRPVTQQTPVAPLQWYLINKSFTDTAQVSVIASVACQQSGGVFAVPTTSYWMNDAMNSINASGINPYPVIVNYQNNSGVWMPNGGSSLVGVAPSLLLLRPKKL